MVGAKTGPEARKNLTLLGGAAPPVRRQPGGPSPPPLKTRVRAPAAPFIASPLRGCQHSSDRFRGRTCSVRAVHGIRAALLGERKPPTPVRPRAGETGLAQAQALPGAARRSPPPAAAADSDTTSERPSKRQKAEYTRWTEAQKSFALEKLANFNDAPVVTLLRRTARRQQAA